MNQCVTVDSALLWAGLKEGLLASVLTFLFVGGLIGLSGWKRPTRMAWLHNKLMFGLILLGTLPASFLFVFGSLLKGIHVQERCLDEGWWWFLAPDAAANIIFAIGMLGLIIGSVYFFKTARPAFLVKKTGNAAVDAAIARYRQPGERVVVGRPRLVVDGAGYYQAVYIQGEGPDAPAEPLLVREDGEVVRDEALARRILLLGSLALDLGDPGQMAQRYELYRRMKALRKGLRKMMTRVPSIRRALEALEQEDDLPRVWEGYAGMAEDFDQIVEAAEIFLAYVERLLKDLEAFGELSWRKRGPKMKELRWEEWEALEKRLEAMAYWNEHPERMQKIEDSGAALARLQQWVDSYGGPMVVSFEKWGKHLAAWVEMWGEVLAADEALKRGGGRRKDFRWLDVSANDIAAWRRRLARGSVKV